eukprot:TRINITY_DN8269_c0_g1_i2.p1 TRINITY_DN8269_c0_g1~~TRINITY_DN8269_c0_g1_i2.p1  ORF type:complete len:734 (+),score=164.05 TRINITY_DN8269_c0_g1_i2:154-2202(+)
MGDKEENNQFKFDFNKHFQNSMDALDSLDENSPTDLKLDVFKEIMRIASDFLEFATSYGKIIISELFVPHQNKTIKPNKSLGGIIGGEKYVVQNILFKFAIDTSGLFNGDDEKAMKIAGHDLKGLKAHFSTRVKGLHYPLTTLIDYKGYRLVAQALLPIDTETIIYGSNDGAKTIHTSNKEINGYIKKVSEYLNLKEHEVGISNKLVYSCVDLEGHYSKEDDRMYCVDFSRTMPCTLPDKFKGRSCHLYCLFRTEFLLNWKLFPLCSDSFSNFLRSQNDSEIHKMEIAFTTKFLRTFHMANCSVQLIKMLERHIELHNSLENMNITEVLHSKGINIRYMGLLSKYMKDHPLKIFLTLEMVSSCIKNDIRKILRMEMKEIKKVLNKPYMVSVVQFLNMVFSNNDDTEYWEMHVRDKLRSRFEFEFDHQNLKQKIFEITRLNPLYPKCNMDGRYYILKRLQMMTGIKFTKTFNNLLKTEPNIFLNNPIFDESDLSSCKERMKPLDVISLTTGFSYNTSAMTKESNGSYLSALHFYEKAIIAFKNGLNSNPLDFDTLINLANCLTKTSKLKLALKNKSRRLDAVEKNSSEIIEARDYFLRALETRPNDPTSHHNYAKFLEKTDEMNEAELSYLTSLNLNPNSIPTLIDYGNFLQIRNLDDDHIVSQKIFDRVGSIKLKIQQHHLN